MAQAQTPISQDLRGESKDSRPAILMRSFFHKHSASSSNVSVAHRSQLIVSVRY
jgi:hypothetical protein